MKSKNHQAEYASGVAQNKPNSEFRMIDSRIFEPNFDGSRTILGVPRDFLFQEYSHLWDHKYQWNTRIQKNNLI